MRLVRYKTNKNKILCGCIENNIIYSLDGNPLENYSIGNEIGNIESTKIMAPCSPNKVVAVAVNYLGVDEYRPDNFEPPFFLKSNTSICGTDDIIKNPFPTLPIWGEPELAVVVKKNITNATDPCLSDSILGFTCANDITVENIDNRDHHLARSKSANNFCPIGPWIDTEFDPSHCLIEGLQNDRVVRKGFSSDQIWQWPRIIEWLSTWITLEPWDVVLTGNPPDISGGMKTSSPGMRYLKDGDIYNVRIQGLGEISNKLVNK